MKRTGRLKTSAFCNMNILTFDTEEWFHANFGSIGQNIGHMDFERSNFPGNMDRILELCSRYNCKATFFVLGCIGERYPEVVKQVAKEGHEIASHGYSHELAYNQTCREFSEDVAKSIWILEDLTGKKVLGYRAPSWSIVEKNIGYLLVLQGLGLKYDASIFPIKTFLYGIPNARREIHRPVIMGRELSLYEIPASVFDIMGKTMGYSGGFYFRLFPGCFIENQLKKTNRLGRPGIVYLHPREIDATERRLSLPLRERFIQYYNVERTYEKLEKLMKNLNFTSIENYLSANIHDDRENDQPYR